MSPRAGEKARSMIYHSNRLFGRAWLQATALGFLLTITAGCSGGDSLGPSAESPSAGAPAPSDSTPAPGDTTPALPGEPGSAPVDSSVTLQPNPSGGGSAPGIVFATFDLDYALLGPVHTGAMRSPDEISILGRLADARTKGARLILKLAGGGDGFVQNGDGTFNFEKWKGMVDRFRNIDFSSYIADGTVLGHYLLDEPNLASRWGGKIIPQETVEAMAEYSKRLWPGMTTFIRVVPSWLANSPINYTHLDAAWAQYAAYKGDPSQWLAKEISVAQSKGLGLMVGMNVLNGGDGSSGIHGTRGGVYNMSASELKTYGTALLSHPYACGFVMWDYRTEYFGRADIKGAMAELSTQARNHAQTSCRQ